MFEMPFMDPVIFSIPGTPLSVHWYGISYLLAFFFGLWYANRRSLNAPGWGITRDMNYDLFFYGFMWLIIGARLGYVLIYGLDYLFPTDKDIDLLYVFKLHQGGLSFHGGFIGVCISYLIFSRKYGMSPFTIADWVVPIIPIGIIFVRAANTINAELWGRVTDSPLGVFFMNLPENSAGAIVKRHPSTIYELLLEGVVMFIVIQWFLRKPRPRMAASGLFVLGYGIFRTCGEFFRQPDAQLGFLYGTEWITRGITLSVPMIVAGAVMLIVAYKLKIFDGKVIPSKTMGI